MLASTCCSRAAYLTPAPDVHASLSAGMTLSHQEKRKGKRASGIVSTRHRFLFLAALKAGDDRSLMNAALISSIGCRR